MCETKFMKLKGKADKLKIIGSLPLIIAGIIRRQKINNDRKNLNTITKIDKINKST